MRIKEKDHKNGGRLSKCRWTETRFSAILELWDEINSFFPVMPHILELEYVWLRTTLHLDLEIENLTHTLTTFIVFIEEAQIMSIETFWIQKFKDSYLNRDHYIYESELQEH